VLEASEDLTMYVVGPRLLGVELLRDVDCGSCGKLWGLIVGTSRMWTIGV
jgi:hypothetical protein